jgi:hypothetical protein
MSHLRKPGSRGRATALRSANALSLQGMRSALPRASRGAVDGYRKIGGVMSHDICWATGKRSYSSQAKARTSMRWTKSNGRRLRAYTCEHCHRWHVTSNMGRVA